MKIVISGASGFIGRQIVPILMSQNYDLLLVGRSPNKLLKKFPTLKSCSYDSFESEAKSADVFLHLATLNNDSQIDEAEFFEVNVDWMVKVFQKAKSTKIKRLINVSSTHALEAEQTSPYARSKAEGLKKLSTEVPKAETIILAAVYGKEWAGNLAKLNMLPSFLAGPLFKVLQSLKPTTHIDLIINHIQHAKKGDGPFILTDNQGDNFIYLSLKRLMDMGFALTVLILFWWLLIIIWGLVYTSSKGPGFFKQTRVGKNGKPFTLYKFRTMATGTVQAGTHEVAASSVTKIGAWLRKTKLDELPQIINIFKNEISLVGPRPCLPQQEDLVRERAVRRVSTLKPGITGLSQIHGIDMSNPIRLAVKDEEYLYRRSLLLDLKIFILTLLGRGQGDKIKS